MTYIHNTLLAAAFIILQRTVCTACVADMRGFHLFSKTRAAVFRVYKP